MVHATFYTPVDQDAQRLPLFSTILKRHAEASPDANIFYVPNKSRQGWSPVTWGNFTALVDALTLKFRVMYHEAIKASHKKHGKAPIVNLLVSPAEDVFAVLHALNAAGLSVIPTNPFLPASTVVEIAQKANSHAIIIGGAYTQHLWSDLKTEAGSKGFKVQVLDDEDLLSHAVKSGDLKQFAASVAQKYKQAENYEPVPIPSPALVMHSTGSTNAPKLIPWSNAAILNQIKRNVALDGFLNGAVRKARPDLAQTAIFVHSKGMHNGEERSFDPEAKERAVFISKEPFAIAPLGIVLKIGFLGVGWPVVFPRFRSTNFTITELLEDLMVSHTMEYSIYAAELSNMANYFSKRMTGAEYEKQQKYKTVMQSIGPIPVGGSRVDRSVAKLCIHHGIKFQVTLGTTESGFVLASNPSRLRKAWGKPLEEITEREIDLSLGMQLFPDTDGAFDESKGEADEGELWISAKDLGFSDPSLANDGDKWRTRDLFKMKNLIDDDGKECKIWEYSCRIDDMIMLGNGENMAPNALEDIIRTELQSHTELGISEVLICGTSRPKPAILIEREVKEDKALKDSQAINGIVAPKKSEKVSEEAFLKQVQQIIAPTFEKLTETLPSFFPLLPQNILVLDPSQRFPRTVKEIPQRGKTELLFKPQLDALFAKNT